MVKIFKLPICPYCHAVTRYSDVKRTTHDKIIKCHNCNKNYRVSYLKGRIILILIVCIALIIINIFLLKQTQGITIQFLAICDAVIVFISILFFPFTVKYKELPRKLQKLSKEEVAAKLGGMPPQL